MYAKFDHLEIPNVVDAPVSRQGASDKKRTIGNKLQKDSGGAVKRTWQMRCIYITYAQAMSLLEYWDDNQYPEGDFWLHEFGSQEATVKAMVDENSVQEVPTPFTDPNTGVRHKDGRSLSFVVEEV